MAETNLDIVIKARDEAEAAFKKAGEHAEKLGDQMKKIGETMTMVGAAITAGLGVAVKGAMDAQVKTQKMDTILNAMGKNSKEVRDKLLDAGKAATELGFNDEAASLSVAKLYQITGDLTKAQELNGLAMDVARRKNIDIESASKAVGAAAMGNGKLLKELGIITKDAGTPMELLAEAQKRAAKSAIDFANTPTGKIEILRQQYSNLNETIGNVLLPTLTKLLDKIGPIVEKIQKWAEENPKLFQTIVIIIGVLGGLAVVIGPLLILLPSLAAGFALLTSPIGLIVIAIFGLIAVGILLYEYWDEFCAAILMIWEEWKSWGIAIWNALGLALMMIVDQIKAWISGAWNAISIKTTEIWEKIKGYFAAVLDWIKTKFKNITDALKLAWDGLWNSLAEKVNSVWEGIKNTIKNSINWIIEKINAMINVVNSVMSKAAGLIGLKGPSIPNIPTLAAGGVVSRPTLAMIGEAGPEAVVPLSRGLAGAGVGGITININGGTYLSEGAALEIGNTIVDVLRKQLRI